MAEFLKLWFVVLEAWLREAWLREELGAGSAALSLVKRFGLLHRITMIRIPKE